MARRYYRRNPRPKDADGNLLNERQVRQILKHFQEIRDGWHTREWFMDMLRAPGSDKQVVRYILKNVDFGMGMSNMGRITPHPELEAYIRELNEEEYPDIELDEDRLQSLIESKDSFPFDVADLIDRLEILVNYNLRLAERLGEPRSSIHELKSRIGRLQRQIETLLEPLDTTPEVEEGDDVAEGEVAVDCSVCGDEDFMWLKPEERRDVVDLSSNQTIYEIQHRLRHLVMELRSAMESHKAKPYIFALEDDIEDVHASLEQARRSSRQ